MPKLTAAEKKWLKKVQTALDECPSDRIAFYMIGDRDIRAFNVEQYDEITDYQNKKSNADFCNAVDACNAAFDQGLVFNNPVESTSG